MTMLLILVFFIIAICLTAYKSIKINVIILIMIIMVFLSVGSGLFPSVLLNHLQTPFVSTAQPKWKHQNAIILLGAGVVKLPVSHAIEPTILAYSRINKVASLYLECIKNNNNCTIIISGGDTLHSGKPEAIVYKDQLLQFGINNSAIKVESRSMNTFKNAEFVSKLLKETQFDNIILVTSGFHLKRALLYFSHFGINVKPVFSDYFAPQFSIIPLAYNFAITDIAVHEYIGIARFYIYNFFGWNFEKNTKNLGSVNREV